MNRDASSKFCEARPTTERSFGQMFEKSFEAEIVSALIENIRWRETCDDVMGRFAKLTLEGNA